MNYQKIRQLEKTIVDLANRGFSHSLIENLTEKTFVLFQDFGTQKYTACYILNKED